MKKEAENESLDAKRVDNEVNSKEINASEPYDFLKIALDEKLDELQILKQSVDQQKDVSGKYYKQLLELKAEFDNYRKRVEREKRDNYNFGKEEVLLNVIGFVDIMEHAIAGSKNAKSVNAVIDGIELVHKELLSMLKRNNVDVVETDCVKFDPVCHEAVEQVKDNTVEENTVVGEFQKGYKINGRVIRAAKVKVSKKEENTEPKSDKNGEKE